MRKNIKALPKDGASRWENLKSQPHVSQRVFNNHKVLPQGWYPICSAKQLKKGQAQSFKILNQRIVVYRSARKQLYALDAFCPHLGTDLGNGKVVGEHIQCYFHKWEFTGEGALAKIPCKAQLESGFQKIKNRSYPVKEAYGHVWVFSAPEALHPIPIPSSLEGRKLTAWRVKEIKLFAHHHIMMANGIDLQHFSAVHNLDIDFDYEITDTQDGVFEWTLRGELPTNSIKGRVARFFMGPQYQYHVKFFGGSAISITYGASQQFMGFDLPSLQILWGCLPQPEGISKAQIFFVSPNYEGLFGKLKVAMVYFFTMLMLIMLRDEDIYAFPNMRFNAHQLIKEDRSLGRFIQLINQLNLSDWGELESD